MKCIVSSERGTYFELWSPLDHLTSLVYKLFSLLKGQHQVKALGIPLSAFHSSVLRE